MSVLFQRIPRRARDDPRDDHAHPVLGTSTAVSTGTAGTRRGSATLGEHFWADIQRQHGLCCGSQMADPPLFGTNRCDREPYRTAALSVFIRCRKCGTPNRFESVRARRTDLALFRGSENPEKCKGCGADMDTIGAFCGERVGVEIVRRPDPGW
jgi:hypothetical protein